MPDAQTSTSRWPPFADHNGSFPSDVEVLDVEGQDLVGPGRCLVQHSPQRLIPWLPFSFDPLERVPFDPPVAVAVPLERLTALAAEGQ